MSSDLLAEFDSFYQAPQSGGPKASATSNIRSASAFEDLSSLESVSLAPNKPNQPQPQWNTPAFGQSDEAWGHFEAIGSKGVQHTSKKSVPGFSGSLRHNESPDGTTRQSGVSKMTDYATNLPRRDKTGLQTASPNIIRRPTIDLFSSNVAYLTESTPDRQRNVVLPSSLSHRTASTSTNTMTPADDRSHVLFDAADELAQNNEEEDDFGDFETVSPRNPQYENSKIESSVQAEKSIKRPSELLMTHDTLKTSPFPYPQAPKSPSFKERNPFADLAVSTPPISGTKSEGFLKTESPVTAWPIYEEKVQTTDPYHDSPAVNDAEEDWGDFEDLPVKSKNVEQTKGGIEVDAWAWDAVDDHPATISAPPTEAPPPTNIPPPSVLLTIFPQLFNLPHFSLFQAVASQPYGLKNRVLSDPSTIDFLRAYLLLATVAARIIAGRKLRWKRDTHLSQAMKIGPAAAHGKGGMKLTGVDKAESTREEREVADLVRIWRDQIGRLRSAIAAANSSLHDGSAHLVVPEITETMIIKVDGAVLTAPKACIICGLKREERIQKVDFQVEDSFGEWWIDHWGHRACRNFWQEHESTLKQR